LFPHLLKQSANYMIQLFVKKPHALLVKVSYSYDSKYLYHHSSVSQVTASFAEVSGSTEIWRVRLNQMTFRTWRQVTQIPYQPFCYRLQMNYCVKIIINYK
jgi:hypothetical protein